MKRLIIGAVVMIVFGTANAGYFEYDMTCEYDRTHNELECTLECRKEVCVLQRHKDVDIDCDMDFSGYSFDCDTYAW